MLSAPTLYLFSLFSIFLLCTITYTLRSPSPFLPSIEIPVFTLVIFPRICSRKKYKKTFVFSSNLVSKSRPFISRIESILFSYTFNFRYYIHTHIYISIRDIRLQTHQWSENTIRTVVRPYWQVHGGYVERSIQMIVTPRVRAEVQAHFNCPELEGAELEDQGGDGTALTHWEKRVFEVNRYKYHYDNDRNDHP